MLRKQRIWTIVISVCVFTAVYLYYVKLDREASIKKYLPMPRIGDIYKMQRETYDNGVYVFYLKVKDIGEQSIYFSKSRTSMMASSDIFLKDFDTTNTEVLSKKELAEIAAGKWMNDSSNNTKLIEIERK